jgi:hypothetical protein
MTSHPKRRIKEFRLYLDNLYLISNTFIPHPVILYIQKVYKSWGFHRFPQCSSIREEINVSDRVIYIRTNKYDPLKVKTGNRET